MTENMITNNKKRLNISTEVIRIRKSKKDGQCNDQRKRTNSNLQAIHRQLKIEKHEPTKNRG
jgi:hypothetical protein